MSLIVVGIIYAEILANRKVTEGVIDDDQRDFRAEKRL